MQPVLAFDVYGTLIDTQGVTTELERRLTDASKAGEFAKRWREKQLEYSFRHALMGAYVPFQNAHEKPWCSPTVRYRRAFRITTTIT